MSSSTSAEAVRPGSGAMFDRIASRYDLLNAMMSFGLDRRWRQHLVKAVSTDPEGHVLDVATGTADVALDILKAAPRSKVTGLDPSGDMLAQGQIKVDKKGLGENLKLVLGDGQNLPFDDDSFTGSCVSFGIRNFPDRDLGLREMIRVTKPGRPVAVLELSEPSHGLLAPFARFHVHTLVPMMGALISGQSEYRYLQQSIAAFPPAERFAEQMRAAGLESVTVTPMTFGAAHLYVGYVA